MTLATFVSGVSQVLKILRGGDYVEKGHNDFEERDNNTEEEEDDPGRFLGGL